MSLNGRTWEELAGTLSIKSLLIKVTIRLPGSWGHIHTCDQLVEAHWTGHFVGSYLNTYFSDEVQALSVSTVPAHTGTPSSSGRYRPYFTKTWSAQEPLLGWKIHHAYENTQGGWTIVAARGVGAPCTAEHREQAPCGDGTRSTKAADSPAHLEIREAVSLGEGGFWAGDVALHQGAGCTVCSVCEN